MAADAKELPTSPQRRASQTSVVDAFREKFADLPNKALEADRKAARPRHSFKEFALRVTLASLGAFTAGVAWLASHNRPEIQNMRTDNPESLIPPSGILEADGLHQELPAGLNLETASSMLPDYKEITVVDPRTGEKTKKFITKEPVKPVYAK